MTAAKLIDRLPRVKQTGPGRWIAGCPLHGKSGRPLSIREIDDRVLLYDFGGCETSAILDALGLSLSDLFEKPLSHYSSPSHSKIPARDLLEIISEEVSAVALIAAGFLEDGVVDETDWHRLATAAARIGRARDHANAR